jgi:gliding-associated putative ABC transporter substrate-binding component GldG
MTKKQSTITLLLTLVALVLALAVSSRLWFRADLTRDKAYTLSKVSRELYKDIPNPVTITYYISGKLAQASPIPREIEDMLEEYATHSRGMINVVRRDPDKAKLEADMTQLGMAPRQIQVVEQNQATVAQVYSGILIEYLDQKSVMPWVISTDTLEYDLTSRIRALVRNETREIGVIVGDPGKSLDYTQNGPNYGLMKQAFQASGYEVREIRAGDEIPDSLKVLFVLGGAENLDDWALYRIDRFIQMGGKALFAVNGVTVDAQSMQARETKDKGLLAMLAGYGASVNTSMVLDKTALSVTFQMNEMNGFTSYRMVRYPEWIGVLPEDGNPDNPITSRFGGVDLFWASPITVSAPEGVKASTLFTSTKDAWLQTKDFQTNPEMLTVPAAGARAGRQVLAVALTGTFPGAFAGKAKPVREGSTETLPDMPKSALPSRIVVVGDTNFIERVSQRDLRNIDFLISAADWLGSDADLASIRNRSSGSGRLDKITDPARRAMVMNLSRGVNVFFVPIVVIVIGLVVCLRRRKTIGGAK